MRRGCDGGGCGVYWLLPQVRFLSFLPYLGLSPFTYRAGGVKQMGFGWHMTPAFRALMRNHIVRAGFTHGEAFLLYL